MSKAMQIAGLKHVTFQGVDYAVPLWTTCVTQDSRANIIAWQNEPYRDGDQWSDFPMGGLRITLSKVGAPFVKVVL